MKNGSLSIAARFCGPLNSANGGYIAGRVASFIGDSAEVMLKRPPPLDTTMQVRSAGEGVELWHGENLVATARPATARPCDLAAADATQAAQAASRTFAASHHKIPGCFVCGPARAEGDGLRIRVGPVSANDRNWEGPLAAPWLPPAEFCDASGTLRAELIWAALDCPTAYAWGSEQGMPPVLLGRQTVSILRRPQAGEACVVVAQRDYRDGRKHYANAMLLGADGAAIAYCNALWIEVTEAQLTANA